MFQVIPLACDDQLLLVEVVGAIKVLPTDTLMQTVKQVIKQPPPTNLDKNKVCSRHTVVLLFEIFVSLYRNGNIYISFVGH